MTGPFLDYDGFLSAERSLYFRFFHGRIKGRKSEYKGSLMYPPDFYMRWCACWQEQAGLLRKKAAGADVEAFFILLTSLRYYEKMVIPSRRYIPVFWRHIMGMDNADFPLLRQIGESGGAVLC